MPLKKIFFDADVLIAGSASKTGSSFLLLQLCEIGLFEGLTCQQVIAECRRNLRKKLPKAEPLFNDIVKRSLEIMKNPSVDEQNRYCNMAHPKDLPILASALTNQADYLITFNTKHYFLQKNNPLTVFQPGEMVKRIRLMLSKLS